MVPGPPRACASPKLSVVCCAQSMKLDFKTEKTPYNLDFRGSGNLCDILIFADPFRVFEYFFL